MLIGYMRISTGEQSLDLQRDALVRLGCERMYEDICSGRALERPGLSKALDAARQGDTPWLCGSWTGSAARFRTSWVWLVICKSAASA